MINIYYKIGWMVVLTLTTLFAVAQAKLVINGGIITINNGAFLVIDNADNTAITRSGAGYIQSEGAGNQVVWAIGDGNGNAYLVPFGNAAGYFPLQCSAASGTGNGRLIFSTYSTATWKNSDNLPPGVANTNKDGADNSAKMIDRFWQISPLGYTKNPALTNLVFTYADPEYAAPNTITEANLVAQRWNPALQSWNDYTPATLINTAGNTVTVSSIESNQLYNWWTLADLKLPVTAGIINFKAIVNNGQVFTSWQTLLEQNIDHFEVWRSKDGITFENAGSVASTGSNSGISNYSFTDASPYTGTSYYQLKSIDKNGGFKWSAIVAVTIDLTAGIFLFPNPAVNAITINSSTHIINSKPVARLYDDKGLLLQMFTLTSASQQLNTIHLAAGVYQLSISYNNFLQTTRFIKL
ncbi:MAG TPA: T9SS type A sorting domain-containing protein [Chitinophagaceae bacterium]|nr:T9SS type A sorting domain-containing protein [Chitinophagaceae bacterium]